uniref:Capsid protein n=1 Tax=Romanomermis culicivorax TaxID=13658 RepID=A0A915KHJ2_ROMCU
RNGKRTIKRTTRRTKIETIRFGLGQNFHGRKPKFSKSKVENVTLTGTMLPDIIYPNSTGVELWRQHLNIPAMQPDVINRMDKNNSREPYILFW